MFPSAFIIRLHSGENTTAEPTTENTTAKPTTENTTAEPTRGTVEIQQ